MSTVSLMTSLLTEDCSKFSPPQHRTLVRRLKTCLWHSKIRWWRRTQTLSTWNIGDVAQAVTQIRRGKTHQTEMPVLPTWKIFAVVHEASAAGEVEAWSGHTDSHWTLVVLLHSSPTATGVAGTAGDQPMLHSQSPASIIPEQLRWTGRRSESANDGYFSLVSVWKKQFDTVRATWETHTNIRIQINSQVTYDCGWRYVTRSLHTRNYEVCRWLWRRTDEHHMISATVLL